MNCDLSIVTIGNFDGLHLGHRMLLKEADILSRKSGVRLKRIMLTFYPHPRQYFHKVHFETLYPLEVKKELALESGLVDEVRVLHFEEIRNMEPETFLHEILMDECHAAGVVVGENFHFGKGERGNAALLKDLCRENGLECGIVSGVKEMGGTMISSTMVRQLMTEGRVAEAAKLLSRPYFLEGNVISGKKLGRTIDVPTLNIPVEEGCLVPKHGVYASVSHVKEKTFRGITNIGDNPTFQEENVRSETYLFDCHEDLYGEKVRIELLEFIRPEQEFASVEELKANIQADIEIVKKYFMRQDFHQYY